KADDHVVICPVPHGGGGGSGKNILRIVAMIAVTVFAAWAGPALAGMYFAGSALAAGAITAGITIAGSMLVNALLPVKPVSNSAGDTMADNTTTYGIDGAKNVS